MTRSILMLVLAVILGVAAAYLAVVYLKTREAQIQAELLGQRDQKIEVVVATSDLPKGASIDAGSFAVREIPADFVHPDAITPAQFENVENRILMEPLTRGKPLLASFVEGRIARDFSDTIALGRRAMTIQVDELGNQSGLTRPGNRIDLFVLATVPPGSFQRAAGAQPVAAAPGQRRGSKFVIPVLQNVEVLATERTTDEEYLELLRFGPPRRIDDYTTMTVDVSPKQAALLALAQDKGEMLSILRNREDDSGATFTGISDTDLLLNSVRMATEEAARAAARSADGVTVTADGKIVTADGTVITDPNVIVKDGVLMTKDGVVLSGKGFRVNAKGQIVDANGRVVDTSKLRVDANGNIIDENGRVVSSGDVRITADGRIIGANGEEIGRLPGAGPGPGIVAEQPIGVPEDDAQPAVAGPLLPAPEDVPQFPLPSEVATTARTVDYIIGGTSKDGVTPVTQIPVAE